MPRKPPEVNQSKNPVLIKSRVEVSSVLQARIELGNEILNRKIKSDADLDTVYVEKEKWHK